MNGWELAYAILSGLTVVGEIFGVLLAIAAIAALICLYLYMPLEPTQREEQEVVEQ